MKHAHSQGRLWSLVVFVFLAWSPQERQPPLASSQSVEWWDRQIKEAKQYVDDPVFRRAALVGSLANPKNSYSKMRLENYNETKWGALPAWNPRVRKVVPSDIGQKVPKPDNTWTALEIPGGWSKEALLQLGEKVFHQYPAQLELSMLTAIANDASVERYGLWRLDDWVGGLIWVDLPGGVFPALTCATCHGSVRKNKTLVPGRPNHRFSLGAALDDHFQVRSWNSDWGGGRIDISRDEINNPVVIADLRPVRYQSYLQRAATIKNSILALAIRLETNTVVITGRAARAPRKAMVALAFYIWQLADSLPLVPEKHPGRKVFEKACASCHKGPGLSGPPTPIEVVRTDPNVANSPQRFTGTYQTPSLRGLSDRQRLTASGSFTSIAQLLDPARTTGGHPYGQDLNAQERSSLIDFLNKL